MASALMFPYRKATKATCRKVCRRASRLSFPASLRLTIPSPHSMLSTHKKRRLNTTHRWAMTCLDQQMVYGELPSSGAAAPFWPWVARGMRTWSNPPRVPKQARTIFALESLDDVVPKTPWTFVLTMESLTRMTDYASQSDLELVEAARQHNDRRAFSELLKRYQRPLYNYILRMVRQPAEAEELFQETFLRIYQNLENFRGGASFSPWAYRIAHNICIDSLRSPRHRTNVPLEAEHGETNQSLADRLEGSSPNPEDELYRQQVGERIQDAVEKLPPAIRAVFVLYQYQHLPYEQIAETLNIPLGTVKSRMHTALRKLSHYLRQLSPTGEDPRESKK